MIVDEQDNKAVYSDGKEIEALLLDIARNYPEDASEEYIADNSRYLINNTFSSVRRNLLNWYPFKKDCDILEIGAGAGALTGLLCDKARHVVAVEMNRSRADIIRARYPNRKNLTIHSGSIQDFTGNQTFDYVIFVGVLEYAAVFSDAANPSEEFLQAACAYLKEDGKLLFAIENRFGLKYWLGASEDHLQTPFAGIKGYPQRKSVQTFSKAALRQLCTEAGVPNIRFYSVYPDYKFPEIICAEGYRASPENLQKINFTYSRNSTLYADERNLYRELSNNEVSDFFANSFLVEASASELPETYPVFAGGKSEVRKQYRISTVIYNDGTVIKIPAHAAAAQHIKNIYTNTAALTKRGLNLLTVTEKNGMLFSTFHKGTSAQDYFAGLLAENDFAGICSFLSSYRQEIVKSSDISSSGTILSELGAMYEGADFGPVLKDGYIDLTFYNAFYENGSFIFYDQEWRFDNVPLRFILYYAVKSSYTRAPVHTAVQLSSLYDFLEINAEQQDAFEKLENHIWQKVLYRSGDLYGGDGYCNRYNESITLEAYNNRFAAEIANRDAHIAQLQESERTLNAQLNDKDGQIRKLSADIRDRDERIEGFLNSRSWRVTKPLRFTKKCIRAIYRLLVPGKLRKAVWIFRHKGMSGMKEYAEEEKFDPTLPEPISYRPNLLADEPYTVHELPACDTPLVSIIIPVYNQFRYTYNCIRSILALPDKVAYEIIIGDDLSTDETKDITSWFPGVRINRNETDHGFIMNCNRAARLARGKYILFLNNDTQVQDGWLESLVRLMECDETIGMAGSKLVYPDGRLQEAGGIIWRDASGWNYGHDKNPELPEYNYVKEVDYISGASIIIRTSLWNEIGGFDERYKPAYYEDSDLAFEVRKRGYRVLYQPQSTVVHFEGISNGTDLNSGLKKYQRENRDKFITKWANELKKQYAGDKDAFLARERNFGKKVILVVDHYVPTFDKDAGSKTTFQYIKMFIAKGFCVKFVGDNYARTEMEPYMSILLQMGVEVLYGIWYSNNIFTYIKQNEKYIDFVYLNRPHITAKYIDFIRNETDIKILYYGHDLHFFRIQREYELTGNTKLLPDIENNRNAEFSIMRKADVVYYPSCLEEKVIREIDSSIHVKAIHAYIFDTDSLTVQYKSRERSGILFVGGFSHTPNVDAVKWFTQEIFPKIRANNPGIDFYIAGSNAPDEIRELDGNGIIFKGFVTEAELARLYASCRIVVVPLRYGAGVKGKVVEALHNGVPIVTTDIGAEGIEGIEDIAAIHNEAGTFADAVLRLYDDGERLGEMSRKSIEFIKENFSMDAAWNVIKGDFA